MTTSDEMVHEPLRRLLLPIDFTKGAELAFGRALLLPLAENARIHVIHVVPPNLPAKEHANAKADAKRRLEDMICRVRDEVMGPNITSGILCGDPFVEIIRCSRRVSAELVVIGRHGRRPLRDMFIGTTAQRVIRKGDVPVLVANLKPSNPYRTPLIATDLEDAAPRVIDLALRILGSTVTRSHVVHAFHVPFEGFVTPTLAAKEKSEYRRFVPREGKGGYEGTFGPVRGHRYSLEDNDSRW